MSTVAVRVRHCRKVSVRCPDCGGHRDVNERHYRRIRSGDAPVVCRLCYTLSLKEPTEDPEEALWFWLVSYGVERNGITATEHVERYGVPPGLGALLSDLRACSYS